MRSNEAGSGPLLRRRAVLGMAASAFVIPAMVLASPRRSEINIRDYGEPDNGDWSGLLFAASQAARRIIFPAGTYLIGEGRLPEDTELRGEGEASILRMAPNARWLLANWPGTGERADARLSLRALQLRGRCDTDGFSEHIHLLRLSGVEDVLIEDVVFRGFRGDGLYLGARPGGAVHNQRLVVRRCHFDGINRQNRQGISVIDAASILIEDNLFERCTRKDMPGAVDFEPNDGNSLVRDVTLRRNRFRNVGGNVGVIAFHLPGPMRSPAADIRILGNHSRAYVGSGAFLHFSPNAPVTPDSAPARLLVQGNDAAEGERSLNVGGRQIDLRDNRFTDFKGSGHIGERASGGVRDMALNNNLFLRCGSVGGNGLSIFSVAGLLLQGNRFIDCGSGRLGASNAIDFNRGASSYVSLLDNVFASPTGKTHIAIQSELTHSFSPETNRLGVNDFGGLKSRLPGPRPA
jgi:hypothetical protein